MALSVCEFRGLDKLICKPELGVMVLCAHGRSTVVGGLPWLICYVLPRSAERITRGSSIFSYALTTGWGGVDMGSLAIWLGCVAVYRSAGAVL